MKRKYNILFSAIIAGTLTALTANDAMAASNFTINPNGALPTTVVPGGTVSALYTITNQTSSTRSGYSIKGLPATVKQDSSNSYCSNPLTLAAHASCVLKLDISGEAKSSFALCRGASCTSASVALNVSAQTMVVSQVASGFYVTPDERPQPIIAANTAAGWTYTFTSNNLPSSFIAAAFTSVSCNSSVCIAVGISAQTIGPAHPFVVKGSAQGTNWVPQTTFPPTASAGSLVSTSCTETSCIIGGYSGIQFNSATPILYTSTDNGQSWTQQSITGNGPNQGSIQQIYCNNAICVATGSYEDSVTGNKVPYIITGNSDGSNWSYSYVGTPDPNADTVLNSIYCNTNNCVAAGYFDNPKTPLIKVGTNIGTNWNDVSGSNLPSNQEAELNKVYCNATACITVGSYDDNDGHAQSLIATSNSHASNWTYTTLPVPSGMTGTLLRSISCSNTACIAAGQGILGADNSIPLIATGSLSGTDWTYTYQASSSMSEQFASVVCNANSCMALGAGTYPLVSISNNNGTSWLDVVTATMPMTFSDFQLGGLTSGSVNGKASTTTPTLNF